MIRGQPLALFLAIVLTNLGHLVTANSGRELQTVIVLYRHGDRTPIDFYPNDPYKDPKYWPVGFGQLTPRGKEMHYKVGQYLRKRYEKHLPLKYDEKDIYVRSTDVDRTLMSAESNLAGLYPPQGKQVWNPSIPWQPIPVHTVPLEDDKELSSHVKCPRLEHDWDTVCDRPEIKAKMEKYAWEIDYINQHAGENVTNMWDVNYLYDTLFIEQLYNLTLPAWTKKVYPEQMQELHDLSFKLSTWTLEMKRLRAGPLIQSIVDFFEGFIAEQVTFKMLMYSGHDTTVSSLLNALGMFDPPVAPAYAAMVIMELFKAGDNTTYEIKFSFRNDTTRDPYDLTLPGCGEYCPLDKFVSLTEHLRPADWHNECGLYKDPTIEAVTVFSLGVTAVLALILLVSVIVACIKRRRPSENDYRYSKILNQS